MNTNELILKMAGQKVSEALKGAEMIKEVPAQTMSVIQDEIDPEIVEIIERILSANGEKISSYKFAGATAKPPLGFHEGIGKAMSGMGKTIRDAWSKYQDPNSKQTFGTFAKNIWNNAGPGNTSIAQGIQDMAATAYHNQVPAGLYAAGATGLGLAGLYGVHKFLD